MKLLTTLKKILQRKPQKQALADIDDHNLAGTFLIAMPNLKDKRFYKTVIYICIHNKNGAIGLVVNKFLDHSKPSKIFAHLIEKHKKNYSTPPIMPSIPVYDGGPVEKERAFIIHTHEYQNNDTIQLAHNISVTGNEKIFLDMMYNNKKPKNYKLVLGYAAWVSGQLEKELAENSWIITPASQNLIFSQEHADLWEQTLKDFNIEPTLLSHHMGHA